ncbi:MAG: efflux RND transporter permease subunit [Acidobacteria bacterium]|nr:efflux RND transporter permease subunit [Acidobacteriota bacterium]
MSSFSIRNPYLIIVLCLGIGVIGVTSLVRMPVDLFPPIHIPVVNVATFYSGMPPAETENLSSHQERFFTLAPGIEHIESRSLPSMSLIKVYFQPGMDPDAAVSGILNLATANLRRLPPGTLPPIVIKGDASSLPVCLITLQGEGMSESQLRDIGHYVIRTQIATVPGAALPQPFGGPVRQIMVYVDPLKLEAHQLGVMDVVRAVNESNLILPAGNVDVGPFNYNVYTNSQLPVDEINHIPLKTLDHASVTVGDIGRVKDAAQLQTNIVRVNGQRAVYLPILKQGGDTSTITVVDGVTSAIRDLLDVPKEMVSQVVFDQSLFVKNAIRNLLLEGGIGLLLASLMVLIFLGSMRATVATVLSIPLSVLAAFVALYIGGSSINIMILGGFALVFSRVIDNSIVVLENIHRHLESGEAPGVAAEKGAKEVALPVLAATLTMIVIFFPVTFLYGVSKFLFSAMALAVVLAMFASYLVAMTVVPLYSAKLIQGHHSSEAAGSTERQPPSDSRGRQFSVWFNRRYGKLLDQYEHLLDFLLARPLATVFGLVGIFVVCFYIYPLLGVSFFPRTDAGQFVINLKAPTGTRLEVTEQEVRKVEEIIRQVVTSEDLGIVVSNIGITTDYSAMYTSNSGPHTAFVQVSLAERHRISSQEYMDRVRERIESELPHLSIYFQSGGLVDGVLNLGLPAPIDIQISGSNLAMAYQIAGQMAEKIRNLPGVSDVLIPQDLDYPTLRLDIDREHAGQLGLSQKEIVSNVITALQSNQMIAPTMWIDPKSGRDYYLTVQYPERQVKTLSDLEAIPLLSPGKRNLARLDAVTAIQREQSPSEIDHYQVRRVIDIYVSPSGEDLGRVAAAIDQIIAETPLPEGLRIDVRGMVQSMRRSFRTFGLGLFLSVALVYLILVAQFRSFMDPLLILLAVPMGLLGVLVTLYFTGSTLNVMSLMGVLMLVGIVVANSILIVDFTKRLRSEGMRAREAVTRACRIRLRPVLMMSLATIIGLLPLALKLGTGAEAYAPLARVIIGGLITSLILTVFIVPITYLLLYRNAEARSSSSTREA